MYKRKKIDIIFYFYLKLNKIAMRDKRSKNSFLSDLFSRFCYPSGPRSDYDPATTTTPR